MKRFVLIAFAFAIAACADGGARNYDNNDLQLVTAYTAKDMCTCLFVMGMSEDYCRAFTKASPAVADVRIDTGNKSVETGALMLWGARARHDGEFGCILE
jgi:hypothetical protein